MEKQGKADDDTVFLGKDHLCGTLHKKRMVQGSFICHDLIGAFLIDSEFLDEFKDKTCFFRLRRTDSELVVHGFDGFDM